ncbi:RNA polymerase sigma factor [Streptomyces chartreusis]|uniref:RNA polymerase sigma factor n=1 Tax=Streptomyces chartreusis TaxID=1969 RepID=UPI0035E2BD85
MTSELLKCSVPVSDVCADLPELVTMKGEGRRRGVGDTLQSVPALGDLACLKRPVVERVEKGGDDPARRKEGREAMATDDWELVQRYCAGDNEAAVQLVRRHWDQLILVATFKLNGNFHDAQDAAGEAFAALADYRGVAPIRSAGSWLRSVALNKAVDKVRRKEARPTDEPEESLTDLREEVEQVVGRLTATEILQALDVQERRVMAVVLEGETGGWQRADQARALNMELYKDFKHALPRAQQQTVEALLLLHMLHPENKPCQGLRTACGVTPGQVSRGPQLTPEGRKAGIEHIGMCKECPAKREKVKDRHWVHGVLLAPSPELYDRVRNICDARRLENKRGNERAQRNLGSEAHGRHGEIRRTTTRPRAQAAGWHASPAGTRSVRRRRPQHRVAKAIGTGVLAAILATAFIHKSGADISLPELDILPGMGASPGPSAHADSGGTRDGEAGDGGTGHGDTDDGKAGDGKAGDGDTGEGKAGDGKAGDGDTGDGSDGDGGTGDGEVGEGNDDEEGAGDGGTGDGNDEDGGVVTPPEDNTPPSVSLAGINASGVGQEVIGSGGSLIQTCGPDGTPTTYSVWVAASDPSGIYFVMLYIQHPTDDWAYESSTGVAEGDAVRFDIPAYRTGPKPQETVQLQLFASAKDTKGNRIDVDLGTLPLHECGEPG